MRELIQKLHRERWLTAREYERLLTELPPELEGYLLQKCPGKDGARQLRRLVQDLVEGPLALFLLEQKSPPEKVSIRLEEDRLVFF